MPIGRRSFLIGAGSLITASFVKDVTAFVSDTQSPLLIKPEMASQTIYYEQVEDHWRLHLGQPQFEIPEPQLLIENLRLHGHKLDTQQQIETFCDIEGWTEEELFKPMDGYAWETQWENNLNPEALAYQYLSDHDVFPDRGKGRWEGNVLFEQFSNPMSCWRWVEVHDEFSLSLLQARLTELALGVTLQAYET
jgi:hypothetical protein